MSAPTQANGQGTFFALMNSCHVPLSACATDQMASTAAGREPRNREALAGLPPRQQLSLSCLGSPRQSIPELELGPTGPLHLVTTAVAPVL